MQRLLNIEWDAVSGVPAKVTAIVLHFLHVIETDVLSIISALPAAGRSPSGARAPAAPATRTSLSPRSPPPDAPAPVPGPRRRPTGTRALRGGQGQYHVAQRLDHPGRFLVGDRDHHQSPRPRRAARAARQRSARRRRPAVGGHRRAGFVGRRALSRWTYHSEARSMTAAMRLGQRRLSSRWKRRGASRRSANRSFNGRWPDGYGQPSPAARRG